MEGKLVVDREALGDNMSYSRYVYARLSGKARENVTISVELAANRGDHTPIELLWRLDLSYKEKDQ